MASFTTTNAKWGKRFLQQSEKIFKLASIELSSNIIEDSPIDKGAFVNNWKVNDNSPFDKNKTSSKNTVKNRVKNIIAEIDLKKETINLQNNAPYSQRLEFDAWSNQAPSGFLRINVKQWDNIVSKIAKKELK